MLPEDHEVKLSRNFSASPEQVFENIAGFANHPKWRSGVTSVSYDPAAKSVVEKNSMGTLPYKILKMDAPRILVTEIDGGKELGFGGTWVFTLAPFKGGTALSITERGQVYGPFFRVMSKLFFPYDRTVKTYLDDLAKALG